MTSIYECKNCGEIVTSDRSVTLYTEPTPYPTFCSVNCAQLYVDARRGKNVRESKKR